MYLTPIVGLELSLFSVRRTVILLTGSGIRFRHCFFWSADSQNSVKHERAAKASERNFTRGCENPYWHPSSLGPRRNLHSLFVLQSEYR